MEEIYRWLIKAGQVLLRLLSFSIFYFVVWFLLSILYVQIFVSPGAIDYYQPAWVYMGAFVLTIIARILYGKKALEEAWWEGGALESILHYNYYCSNISVYQLG
jgi:hypothetical protein